MIFKRGAFFSFCLIFLFSFFSFSFVFGVYPDFEFTQTSYSSGVVDVVGRSSSGTQVSLSVNGISVGVGQDVFSSGLNLTVSALSMPSANVGIGGSINFVNADNDDIVWLKFSNGMECVLAPGSSCVKSFSSEGSISVVNGNNASATAGVIVVADELVDFNFMGVENHLKNGVNEFKFVQKSGAGFVDSSEFVYSVSYQKYTSVITINEFENVTREREVQISGGISDSTDELFYTVNLNPDTLGNLGALNKIEHIGTAFNATISGLSEGHNDIYFITTAVGNNKVFTGVKATSVMVDSIAPTLEIVSAQFSSGGNVYEIGDVNGAYINGNSLILNVSCDASYINVTLNNVTSQTDVVNDSAIVTLSLVRGANNLTLIAVDGAGNIAKQAHQINFDDTKPQIVDGSLKPSSMFEKKVSHFFFENIEGQINKGDVTVTVFSIGENAKDYSGTSITCDMFEDVYRQSLAQNTGVSGSRSFVRRDGDVGIDTNATQVSLLNLMFGKKTVTADGDGNFDALIGLQERTSSYSDLKMADRDADRVADDKNTKSPKVTTVKSKNTICFVMQDRYGNFNIESRSVTLDAGNTMWKPDEITTIPNTVYASEIADTGDLRQGGGRVEFGMIARFSYIGSGTVNDITSFKIRTDTDIGEYSKYVKPDVSRMNFKFDKSTDEMIVYVPVMVYPFGSLEPADYPDELKMGFKAWSDYTVGDTDIPIDTVNAIYFQTTVNIERPFDHAKWLTPEMLEKTQKFLNKTIEFTETAVEWTGYASIAGVLTCTAYKFKYGFEVARINALPADTADKQTQLDEAKRKMFMICDRVACTASPFECDKDAGTDGFYDVLDDKGKTVKNPKTDDVKNNPNAQFTMEQEDADGNTGELLGRVTDFEITDDKPKNCMVGETPGVIITADVTKYEKDGYAWVTTSEKSEQLLRGQCVEATWVGEDGKTPCTPTIVGGVNQGNCQVGSVNLQGVSGVCYTKGAPKFDDTRCNAGGLTFGMMDTPLAGWDPADNVLESLACGCITDTYSHLKNYLKIQKSIYMCLEQAKIGNVQGSYCERLLGQAVCDVATNLVFKTIVPQVSKRTGTDGEDKHEGKSFFKGFYDGLKDGDKVLNDRYEGTFWTKSGLGTDQIVNKVCLASLTGDWSTFTDNILSDIDKNEVEPVFGPMIPESRMQGYNPLTGELSIMYRLTYGVVSGGQYIKSKLTFICDKNEANGEYCPDSGYYSSDSASSGIKSRTYSVSKGGSVQDLIVVIDKNAKFWFNVVEIEHTYELKGAKKTYVQREGIIHKGEVIASCYFTGGVLGSGAGFNCKSIFSSEAMMSMYKIDDAKVVPTEQKAFFPGNNVVLDLDYSINAAGSQSNFYLAYLAECQGVDGVATRFGKSSVSVSVGDGNAGYRALTLSSDGANTGGLSLSHGSGKTFVNLFTVPNLGGVSKTGSNIFTLELSSNDLSSMTGSSCDVGTKKMSGYSIKFRSTNKDKDISYSISSNSGFDFSGNADATVDYGQGKLVPIKINCDGSSNSYELEITVSTNDDLNDLVVDLVEETDSTKKIKSFRNGDAGYKDSGSFDKLREGDCKLFLRLMPESDISSINDRNFKNYSLGNSDSNDVLVDKELAALGKMFETRFSIAKPDTNNHFDYFAMLAPFDESSYCVKMDKDKKPKNDLKIRVDGFYQSNDASNSGDVTISYRIDNERFSGSLGRVDNVGVGDLKDVVVSKTELGNYLDGGYSTDAVFSYEVKGKGGKVIAGPGDSRKIYITLSDDCSGTRVGGTGGGDTGITKEECNAEKKAFDNKNNVCCGDNEEYDGECKACETGKNFNDRIFVCENVVD